MTFATTKTNERVNKMTANININDMFPGKYLKASDTTGRDTVLTIKDVRQESLGQGEEAELKPIVYFSELEKGLVLNKTNANTISGLFGPNTGDWVGKRIAIYEAEVAFQGRMTNAIRVRLKAPTSAAVSPAASPSSEAWAYYYDLVTQAENLNIDVTDVDDDISARDLHKASKALKDAIADAMNTVID